MGAVVIRSRNRRIKERKEIELTHIGNTFREIGFANLLEINQG